jgi:hypothetical protein
LTKETRSNEELEWQRTSLIAAILINQNRPKGKKPIKPDELNPYSTEKPPEEVVKNALEIADMMRELSPKSKPKK